MYIHGKQFTLLLLYPHILKQAYVTSVTYLSQTKTKADFIKKKLQNFSCFFYSQKLLLIICPDMEIYSISDLIFFQWPTPVAVAVLVLLPGRVLPITAPFTYPMARLVPRGTVQGYVWFFLYSCIGISIVYKYVNDLYQ